MARLAVEQSRVEAFATAMNSMTSTINGLNNLLFVLCALAMLAMLGAPTNATGTRRIIQVVVLVLMIFVMIISLCKNLIALTGPNRHWEHEKKRLLNDPRIQSSVGINGKYNFERFDHWLDAHELSALRAFGIPVTLSLTRSAASLLVSAVTIGTYVVLREELRGLIA